MKDISAVQCSLMTHLLRFLMYLFILQSLYIYKYISIHNLYITSIHNFIKSGKYMLVVVTCCCHSHLVKWDSSDGIRLQALLLIVLFCLFEIDLSLYRKSITFSLILYNSGNLSDRLFFPVRRGPYRIRYRLFWWRRNFN